MGRNLCASADAGVDRAKSQAARGGGIVPFRLGHSGPECGSAAGRAPPESVFLRRGRDIRPDRPGSLGARHRRDKRLQRQCRSCRGVYAGCHHFRIEGRPAADQAGAQGRQARAAETDGCTRLWLDRRTGLDGRNRQTGRGPDGGCSAGRDGAGLRSVPCARNRRPVRHRAGWSGRAFLPLRCRLAAHALAA